MRQVIRRILVLLIMSAQLIACTKTKGSPFIESSPKDSQIGTTLEVETKPNEDFFSCDCEVGNTNNNYSTHGCFAEKDGWVYFVDRSKGGLLSRRRTDDTGLMNYNEKPVSSINVVGDWIYYQKRILHDESAIFRMNIDGTNVEKISPILNDYNSCANFVVRGEYIYFSNYEDNSSIYRMKTDGSDLVKLNDFVSYSLNLDGEWLYYVRMDQTDSLGNELRRIRADGTRDELLATGSCTTILPHKDWIYYIESGSKEKSLYRIKSNGQDKKVLVKESVCGINIFEDTLYYVISENGMLYFSALDGSGAKLLMKERASGIHIAGGWLYFANIGEFNRPYRIRLDGTGLEKAYRPNLVKSDLKGDGFAQGIGSHNANINSRFVRSTDWIYFSLDSYQGEIRKMLRNGNSHNTVAKVPGSGLNLVGHWLYFIDSSLYDSLARVRVDGKSYETILDVTASELLVKDQWMYFINASDEERIYRLKIDGSGLEKLTNQSARNLQLEEDWLYYEPSLSSSSQDEEGIYKVKLDGTEKKLVTDLAIERMNVFDHWIYYETKQDHQLRRITIDGGEDQKLSGEMGLLYGVYDEWVYWYSTDKEKGMFRMDLNGNNKTLVLGPGNYSLVHFLEDKMVYFDNDRMKYYLMEMDGSLRKEFKP